MTDYPSAFFKRYYEEVDEQIEGAVLLDGLWWAVVENDGELTYAQLHRVECSRCWGDGYTRKGRRAEECPNCDGYGDYWEPEAEQVNTPLTYAEWEARNRQRRYLKTRLGKGTTL